MQRNRFAHWSALAAGTVLLSGCGGSGGSGSSDNAQIRGIDAAVNGGNAQILVNGGSIYGHMTYFNSNGGQSSPYLFLKSGSSSFSFSTDATLGANESIRTTNSSLNSGQFYSTVLIGRADVPGVNGANDARFLQSILLPQRGAAPSNAAAVRVVNAAPDAGYQSASNAAGQVTLTLTPQGGASASNTYTNIGYGSASDYQNIPGGAYTVTLTTGASTLTPATTTLTVNNGTVSTLFVTEPGSAPSYDVRLISE